MAPNDFTHLHVHSEFSLLDGLGRITELVADAKEQGFDSLAITDHGALYGAVAFYKACADAKIKPIIGVETYIARRSMSDREGKADAQPYHLILLAKDWTGYQNLCRIVTDAHVDGYYYKPRIDREYLARHAEGLVGLSACLNGEVARAIETGDMDEARGIAGSYRDILGPGNFFFELQDHSLPELHALNKALLIMSCDTAPGGDHSAPGLRSTASTLLNEEGAFNEDVVEAKLARDTKKCINSPRGGAVPSRCATRRPSLL